MSIIGSEVQENFDTICHTEVCLTFSRLRALFTEQEKLKGQTQSHLKASVKNVKEKIRGQCSFPHKNSFSFLDNFVQG